MMSVQINFTSTDEGVVKALEKMTAQTEKLKQELKEMHKETKHGHEEAGHLVEGFKEIVTGAAAMTIGFTSVEGGIEKLIDLWKEMRKEMEEAGAAHHEFSEGIIKDMAKVGDIKNAPKIEAAIKASAGTIKREDFKQGIAGVSGAAPFLGIEQRIALGKEAGKMGGVGQDPAAFGGLMGGMAHFFPGKSASDLASITAEFQSQTGNAADDINSPRFKKAMSDLQRAGMSGEEALGLGAAGIKGGLRADTFSTLAQGLTEEIKPGHGRMTPEDRLKQTMRGKSPQERLAMMKSNPELAQALLGKDEAFKLGGLDMGFATSVSEKLKATEGRDAFQEAEHALGQTSYGRDFQQAHGAELQSEKQAQTFQEKEAELKNVRKFAEGARDDLNWAEKLSLRTTTRGALWGGGKGAGADMPGAEVLAELAYKGYVPQAKAYEELEKYGEGSQQHFVKRLAHYRTNMEGGGNSGNEKDLLAEILNELKAMHGDHGTKNVETHGEHGP